MTGVEVRGASFFPDDPLADAWKRFNWAQRHGQTLHKALEDYGKTGPYAVGTKREGDRWNASFHRLVDPRVETEWFDRFANLLGVYLDGLRASLNYLAYEIALLAIREDPSLVDERLDYRDRLHPEWVEFPIFNKPAKYRSTNKVGKLPDMYRSEIEAIQPYNGDFQGLWILQELAAQYRHRLVHPIAILPLSEHYGISVDGRLATEADIEIVHHDGPLKDGDVVMFFTVNAEANADVRAQTAISPGIDNDVCAGQQLMDVVNSMGQDVGRVFALLEPKFFVRSARIETGPDGGMVVVIDP